MKNSKMKTIIAAITVVVITLTIVAFTGKSETVQFNTTKVSEELVEITVMATGYIQPVEEVEVGTQVSGVIRKLYVDYNSHVKKGQLLAELDKMTLQEKLNQANATVNKAQSDLTYAQLNYDRVAKLYDRKAATDVALEESVNRLDQAKSSLQTAKATLNQARVDLSYASIYSPIDGVVLDRSVNTGQTVAASFNTPTLFTIAEDLTKMQVEADVDEADIGQVKIGQKVTFTVDAYNEDVFEGSVSQIRLQPKVTNNVVTYTVIVDAPNPNEKLYPGMTASITIEIHSETGLIVPLEAINFNMTEELREKLDISPSSAAGKNNGTRKVWISRNGSVEERSITTGINDGINYIVKSGLATGDEVILSAHIGKKTKSSSKPVSIMPARPH